jgi:hypothetical protein
MEIHIKLKLPGSYLSSKTMYWVLSDIVNNINKCIYESILEIYPNVPKRELKRKIKQLTILYFTDINKGSWVLDLLGALGGDILKICCTLGIEIVKDNPTFQIVKDKINGVISATIGKKMKDKFDGRTKLGSFLIETKKIEMIIKPDKTQIFKMETTLIRRPDARFDFSGDNNTEIDNALKDIEKLKGELNKKKK